MLNFVHCSLVLRHLKMYIEFIVLRELKQYNKHMTCRYFASNLPTDDPSICILIGRGIQKQNSFSENK